MGVMEFRLLHPLDEQTETRARRFNERVTYLRHGLVEISSNSSVVKQYHGAHLICNGPLPALSLSIRIQFS